jgi:recombination protein RecR
MSHYPPSLIRLIRNLSKLPGIGEKTAERLALHLLRAPAQEVQHLAESMMHLKERIRLCSSCFALSDQAECDICRNPARDRGLVCVVEQPSDLISIEKSGAFNGVYHVLGGVLSPMNAIGPDDLRIKELIKRLESQTVREVILATGTSVEGDSTAAYIAQLLSTFSLKVTRIASGVPIGGDLKYVDQVTLRRALETRHDI